MEEQCLHSNTVICFVTEREYEKIIKTDPTISFHRVFDMLDEITKMNYGNLGRYFE